MSVSLTAEHYTQGAAFVAEKQHLFTQAWLPLGAVAQLAATGDYVSANVGGWPLLAVRGADGTVRTLLNTCRHKNMLVAEQAQGHCEFFRCRFHGWTYRLDGRFREAPAPVAPADPASDAHHLTLLRTQMVHGMVCAHLQPRAADGEFAAVAGYAAHDYLGAVTTDIACNWKTLLEHALASEPAAAWQWPLLLAHRLGEVQVMQQIMPRSFLRTRLISHVYGNADRAAALAPVQAHADAWQAACEALQAARANGSVFNGENTSIAALHRQVLAACAAAGA